MLYIPKVLDFPEILPPLDPELREPYDRIHVREKAQDSRDAYSYHGIDPKKVCGIAVRPDLHVAYIGEL